jgi:hypothetical protein
MAKKAKKTKYARSSRSDVKREMDPLQEGNGEERPRRQRRQGQEPQAGDCHRSLGSPQGGQARSKEKIVMAGVDAVIF